MRQPHWRLFKRDPCQLPFSRRIGPLAMPGLPFHSALRYFARSKAATKADHGLLYRFQIDPRRGEFREVANPAQSCRVDLDQARGRDLLVEQAAEVDQDMVIRSRYTRGDMVIDEVGHGIGVDGPILEDRERA